MGLLTRFGLGRCWLVLFVVIIAQEEVILDLYVLEAPLELYKFDMLALLQPEEDHLDVVVEGFAKVGAPEERSGDQERSQCRVVIDRLAEKFRSELVCHDVVQGESARSQMLLALGVRSGDHIPFRLHVK